MSKTGQTHVVMVIRCGWRRRDTKYRVIKFQNHPKLGAKIPDPYTYCFTKCGEEE
jgi:hypothetical protein